LSTDAAKRPEAPSLAEDSHPQESAPSMRARVQARTAEYRETANEMRESAATHYKDFREHPGQSAREGAKSFGGMLRKFGPVFIGTYLSIYLVTLSALFTGVQSGALDPVVLFGWLGQESTTNGDTTMSTVQYVVDFMQNHTWTKPYAGIIEKNPAFANFAVSWIAVKFTEPIRLPIALAVTPKVARYLGYNPKETEEEHRTTEADSSASPDLSAKETQSSSSSSGSSKS
jgi:Protein of unknown function (DUF1279)